MNHHDHAAQPRAQIAGLPSTPAAACRCHMDAQQLICTVRDIKRRQLPQQSQITLLSDALQAFVRNPLNRRSLPFGQVSSGLYTRLLLSSFADDFQIVVVLWGAGSRSPIHDHRDTVGAVAALSGATHETKYQRHGQPGDTVRLTQGDTIELRQDTVSPILPDESTQLHAMANRSAEWAATVHVYLTPVMDFHVYEPLGDDRYERVGKRLWFDAENAWAVGVSRNREMSLRATAAGIADTTPA